MDLGRLVKSLILTSLVGFSSCSSSNEKDPRYEVYRAPDSKHTLVHVGQINQRNFWTEEGAAKLQSEVYHILDRFVSSGNRNLYYGDFKEAESIRIVSDTLKHKKLAAEEDNIKFSDITALCYFGASFILESEGKVTLKSVKGLSSSERRKMQDSYTREPFFKPVFKSVAEIIESRRKIYLGLQGKMGDEMLKSMLEDDPTNNTYLLVFNDNYNFRENVLRWNSKNPSNKVSLIKITPPSLVKN